MFFVVNRVRLRRTIDLTRDDRRKAQQGKDGPFLRIEARDGQLRLTGRRVEATIPATVYEPGVLFLRVTLFHTLLAMMTDTRTMAIQVAVDGLHFGDTKLPWDVGDMLLYPDPAHAPAVHPEESLPLPEKVVVDPPPKAESGEGTLFADLDK